MTIVRFYDYDRTLEMCIALLKSDPEMFDDMAYVIGHVDGEMQEAMM